MADHGGPCNVLQKEQCVRRMMKMDQFLEKVSLMWLCV